MSNGETPTPKEAMEVAKELEKKEVDIDKIKVGDKIRIKQPEGISYDLPEDADVGQGGYPNKEHWIDTEVTEVHPSEDPDDQFVITEKNVRQGSSIIDEFWVGNMWYEDGILHADTTIDD